MVFVHGLLGDREQTWTTDGVLWPRDLLASDLPNARILTFGYDAGVVRLDGNQISNMTMEIHAADLCESLARLRASTDTVIFNLHQV